MLTAFGRPVRQWQESFEQGELVIRLTFDDPSQMSGRCVVVLRGRRAARLKLAQRAEIERLPLLPRDVQT